MFKISEQRNEKRKKVNMKNCKMQVVKKKTSNIAL